jgi:hypothetical protein
MPVAGKWRLFGGDEEGYIDILTENLTLMSRDGQ